MASNEMKLNKFNQAINHYAEEQRRKIENEVAEFKQRELEEAEVEVLTEAYHLIQKEMAEMRGSITKDIAHREMDARRQLLEKRQKITDEVFQSASQKLLEFTKTEKYISLLKKFAEEISALFLKKSSDVKDTVICLKPDDEKHWKILQQNFSIPCTLKIDEEITIGGMCAYSPSLGFMADSTLDSMLEDQREWFEENSQMAVV